MALARVTTVADELEAEIVTGLLESEGIASFVKRTNDVAPSGGAGSIDDTGRIEIWVDETEADRARALAAPADESA